MDTVAKSILIGVLVAVFAAPLLSQTDKAKKPETEQCSCPTVSVRSNLNLVKLGETVEFYVTSSDLKVLKGPFEWTVSKGEITSGQGTSRIQVLLADEARYRKPTSTSSTTTELPPGFTPSKEPTSWLIPYSADWPRRSRTLTATVTLPESKSCKCPTASFTIDIERPTEIENKPANVQDLKLGKKQVYGNCPPGRRLQPGEDGNRLIEVTTSATDAENDVLAYSYTVSGGKIVGEGSDVKWDLRDVLPGTYTITAAVDDGCGFCGATKTQEVTVVACELVHIDCPSIDIAGPESLKPTGLVAFTANVSGGTQESVTYTWSVTNAEIVEGQGSPSITAKMPPDVSEKDLSVTVRIRGLDPRGACLDSVTKEYRSGRVKP